MHRFKFYLLLAVLYSCSGLGYGGITTEKPVTLDLYQTSNQLVSVAPVETSSTSEALTLPPPSTEKPRTTTSTTTTSTTTTSTTTPSTTTTSTTTTSTTAPPPPEPTPAPTPTPTPGPVPAPTQGKWSYKDEKTNKTCILLEFAAQLNVTYPVVKDNTLASVVLNVPVNATVVNGSCTASDQWLTISWLSEGLVGSLPNNLTLIYQKNVTTKDYALRSLNITLTPELFVNSTVKGVISLSHGSEWQTPLETSYRCNPATRLNLTAETESVVAGLTLSRLQEEAFRNVTGEQFSAARECGGGDVPDAVPIAVGCALGGLVVVVLIAYLVGRRRSAARGYLSM